MITLRNLYERIVETTGLDVMTLGSLKAAIANCMADLTSRGYKTFKELHLSDLTVKKETDRFVVLSSPSYVSKALYLRLFFPQQALVARRVSLSDPRIGCKYIDGEFRSAVRPGEAIYYTKGDEIYIEWHSTCGETLEEISFGYYEKLHMPDNFPEDPDQIDDMDGCEIDIREEFEDAIVFYAAYFYYARYIKDTDKIQFYDSKYKYYVEDISHELAYEDEFNEEDSVIKVEDI